MIALLISMCFVLALALGLVCVLVVRLLRGQDEAPQWASLDRRLDGHLSTLGDRLDTLLGRVGQIQSFGQDLNRIKSILTNVKTRGAWGEYLLGDILGQTLAPEQFAKNVQPIPGSHATVEFALRLPGREDETVWLPVDSKFPMDDYHRMIQAARTGDAQAHGQAKKSLVNAVRAAAKSIANKYLFPPHTTDFAVMFVPVEGLYGEISNQVGLIEELQTRFRVLVAGPSTFAALVNALRVGFRTLAVNEQTTEIWRALAAVKAEFGKFDAALDTLAARLASATKAVEATQQRSRVMQKALRQAEQPPQDAS